MPTKKIRVGFIPRSDVLELIKQLSYESNLSNSKIINILVEEALYKRGMFNINNGKKYNREVNDNIDERNKINIENVNNEFAYIFNNKSLKDQNLYSREDNEDYLDKEVYAKFLMFLQFKEQIEKSNLN